MRRMVLVLLVVMLAACSDSPVAPEMPEPPRSISGDYSGTMSATNGIAISGAALTVGLQEGSVARGEWNAIGSVGVPGARVDYIYRGHIQLSVQRDDRTLIGRWNIEVVEPVSNVIVCTDSADYRGRIDPDGALFIASAGFGDCITPVGPGPVGIQSTWTPLTFAR